MIIGIFAHYAERFRWTHRLYGSVPAGLTCLSKLLALLGWDVTRKPSYQNVFERSFDKKFGIETATLVLTDALDVESEMKPLIEYYEPVDALEFALTLESLQRSFEGWTFIDVGSGKGRSLLLASLFDFDRVIGLELSASLHEVAEQNLRRQRREDLMCRDVQSICTDALEYELPTDPLVLFFFNPFKEDLMARMLANIRESYLRSPRPIILIYHNPIFRSLMDEAEFLEPHAPGPVGEGWSVFRADATSELALESESLEEAAMANC